MPALRRRSGRSACSLGVKPILSKCADCRSPADGGVHAGGGVAVEKGEPRQPGSPELSLLLRRRAEELEREIETAICVGSERRRPGRGLQREDRPRAPSSFQLGSNVTACGRFCTDLPLRASRQRRCLTWSFRRIGSSRCRSRLVFCVESRRRLWCRVDACALLRRCSVAIGEGFEPAGDFGC